MKRIFFKVVAPDEYALKYFDKKRLLNIHQLNLLEIQSLLLSRSRAFLNYLLEG